MTRAVAFLWIALLAATLGVTAQETAPSAPASQSAPATSSTSSSTSTTGSTAATGAAANTQSDAVSPQATSPAQASSSGQPASANANQNLPKTASFLPLVALLGLGSLAAGFIMRR